MNDIEAIDAMRRGEFVRHNQTKTIWVLEDKDNKLGSGDGTGCSYTEVIEESPGFFVYKPGSCPVAELSMDPDAWTSLTPTN